MKTKYPKQFGCFPGEENHQYAPRLDIKLHPKNAWQSHENPLAHPNFESHL
jgi:hypothetical protein